MTSNYGPFGASLLTRTGCGLVLTTALLCWAGMGLPAALAAALVVESVCGLASLTVWLVRRN
jgi:hypothetical protein